MASSLFGQESLRRSTNCVLTGFTVVPGPRPLFPLATLGPLTHPVIYNHVFLTTSKHPFQISIEVYPYLPVQTPGRRTDEGARADDDCPGEGQQGHQAAHRREERSHAGRVKEQGLANSPKPRIHRESLSIL